MDVTLDIQDGVALIKMDDGKKNVITVTALEGIHAAFDKAEADAKSIVFAGRPGSFCAGFHMPTILGDDRDAIRALATGGQCLAVRLWSCPTPVLAACTGHGFTIGAIWMSCCDTRVGELGDFLIGLNESKLGVPLPDWALVPLRERIQPNEWIPAIAQSRLYDPQAAVEAGLLDEVVPAGQAIDRACALAAEFGAFPNGAYGLNKLRMRRDSVELMKAPLN